MHRACRAVGRTAGEQEASTVTQTGAAFPQARTPFATFDLTPNSWFSGRSASAEGVT